MRTLALLLLLPAAPAGDSPPPRGKVEDVKAGQKPAEVRDLLGPPARVARQVYYKGWVEQWLYEQPRPARVEFECRVGQVARVRAVHFGNGR